jgi:hypothetical protein
LALNAAVKLVSLSCSKNFARVAVSVDVHGGQVGDEEVQRQYPCAWDRRNSAHPESFLDALVRFQRL